MRAARFGEPGRGVLDRGVLDAVDGRGLDVTADFRGARFLTGDSPLIPRASKMSTRGFTSEGTKMLVHVCRMSKSVGWTSEKARQKERTLRDHENEF